MNRKLCERLDSADVRIKAMWPFPVFPAPDQMAEVFEFQDDVADWPAPLASLLNGLSSEARDALFENARDFDDAFEELANLAIDRQTFGWLGIAENPVFTATGKGAASFSWGHYRTKVFFAPTAEQLLEQAATWGESNFAAATAEGGAA